MAASLLNTALFARLTQTISEIQCIKKNPILTALVPIFALTITFFITFLATSLSIITCPFHMTIDQMNQDSHMNMTKFCYEVILKLDADQIEPNEKSEMVS